MMTSRASMSSVYCEPLLALANVVMAAAVVESSDAVAVDGLQLRQPTAPAGDVIQ